MTKVRHKKSATWKKRADCKKDNVKKAQFEKSDKNEIREIVHKNGAPECRIG